MKRKLIIDGNAVYEIDENCMLRRRLDKNKQETGSEETDRREKKTEKTEN